MKHLIDQFIQSCTIAHWDIFEPDCSLFSDELVYTISFIRDSKAAKFVSDYAERPYVTFFVVAFFFVPYLRANIEG